MPDRAEMVREQLAARGISDPRVLAAMARIPREAFVASDQRAHAYEDRALSIGHEQTISQPWIVAAICQALTLTGTERVLEIGSGSGYSTAVLASLAREVVGYEFVPELAEAAGRRLAEQGIRNAKVLAGDGVSEAGGRFEAIAVHARVREVPRELARLLEPGGRMVAPLVVDEDGEALTVLTLVGDPAGTGPIELDAEVIAPTRFVPLRGASDAAI